MASVFQGVAHPAEQRNLADTIVAAVFMGLVRERLTKGYQVFIGYGGGFDAYEGSQVQGQKKDPSGPEADLHTELLGILSNKFVAYKDQLVIGAANKWVDASKGRRENASTSSYVITGAMSDKQVHVEMSKKAKQLALDCLNSNQKMGTLKERGAYYGVADCYNGEVFGPVATSRQVFWAENSPDRWMNPSRGWIYTNQERNEVASGSNAKMDDTDDEQLIASGLSERMSGYVLGYCHGMIFAEHLCKVFKGGTAYEISMNEQTCKNASCFGCSSFMFANGMPPSWMHLGGAQSWAPLPEKATNFGYSAHIRNDKLIVETARSMNKAWADATASWMQTGVGYTTKSPKNATLKAAFSGKSTRQIANFFLDALTIHGRDDLERILAILKHGF